MPDTTVRYGVTRALTDAFREIRGVRNDLINQENDRTRLAQSQQGLDIQQANANRAADEYAIKRPEMMAEAQAKTAVSQETLQQYQKNLARRNTVIDTNMLPKDNAYLNATANALRAGGFFKEGQPFTVGDWEDGQKWMDDNPEMVKMQFGDEYNKISQKIQSVQAPLMVSKQKLDEIKGRLASPDVDIAEKAKLEKQAQSIEGDIAAASGQLEPLMAQSQQLAQTMGASNSMIWFKQFEMENPNILKSLDKDTLNAYLFARANHDPKGAQDVLLAAAKQKETKAASFQSKGITEKGGYQVVFNPDPNNPQTFVLKPDGSREIYDPAKHGKIMSETMSQTTVNIQSQDKGEPFSTWSKDDKQFLFEQKRLGINPDFGTGRNSVRDRKDFTKEYAAWSRGKGYTGAEAGVETLDAGALKKSLETQQKIYGPMNSFVINLGKQVDRMDTISKDLGRTDVRLLNVPIRDLRKRVKGSPIESKVDMYVTEISNEMGKISTGSSASIRELSEGAQERWAKIHDQSLSVADLMDVLRETKHAADMRKESVKEGISQTRQQLQGIGTSNKGANTSKSGPTLQEFLSKARAANPNATDEELTAFYNKKYGGQ